MKGAWPTILLIYYYFKLSFNMRPSQLQILFHTDFIFFPSSPPAHICHLKKLSIFLCSSIFFFSS